MREAFSWVSPRSALGDVAPLRQTPEPTQPSTEQGHGELGTLQDHGIRIFHALGNRLLTCAFTVENWDWEYLIVSEEPGSAASCLGR